MKSENVRYGLMLAKPQLDVLENDNHGFHRMSAFNSLVSMTAIEPYTYTKGHYSVDLTEGQLAISKVELARLWHCDADTALKVLRIFAAAGLLSVVANNRTSIITIYCIESWNVDGKEEPIKNRHYQRTHNTGEYKPTARPLSNKKGNDEVPKVQGKQLKNEVPKTVTASEAMTEDLGTTMTPINEKKSEASLPKVSYPRLMITETKGVPSPSSPAPMFMPDSNKQITSRQTSSCNNCKHPRRTLADKKNDKGFCSKPKHRRDLGRS